MKRKYPFFMLLILLAQAGTVLADTRQARCEVYRRGSDQAETVVPCTYMQEQGTITILRNDGATHELVPTGGMDAMYRDDYGFLVTRRDDLGSAGMLFRFEDKSVHVYWDAPAPSPDKTDTANPTAPYTTDDYDATTRLRCGNQGRPVAEGCAAGILRMEDGVSIVVTSPGGEAFTINVMGNHVNASDGREVRAVLDGDTWIVNVDGRETYEIPLAAIDGG